MRRKLGTAIGLGILALAALAACATADSPASEGSEGQGDGIGGQPDGGTDTISPNPVDAEPGANGGAEDGECPSGDDPCHLHEQCGCPEDDACDIEFTDFDDNEFSDQLTCRGVAIPGDELSACDGAEECGPGFQCISGHCRAYCEDDGDCGGPGGECALTRAGSERSDDSLCTKSCEPDFEADHGEACPPGFSCYIRFFGSDEDPRILTDCMSTGDAGLDEDCSDTRCGEGLTCISFGDDSSRCRFRCHEDQTCENGEPCELFSDDDGDGGTVVEDREYGFCPT